MSIAREYAENPHIELNMDEMENEARAYTRSFSNSVHTFSFNDNSTIVIEKSTVRTVIDHEGVTDYKLKRTEDALQTLIEVLDGNTASDIEQMGFDEKFSEKVYGIITEFINRD